jgi:hypothetical protein
MKISLSQLSFGGTILTLLWGSSLALANDALTSRYNNVIRTCLFQHVKELDDKISSAEVVGRALFDQCKGANFDLWQSFAKSQRRAYVESYEGAQLKWTTGLVLYVRAHPN